MLIVSICAFLVAVTIEVAIEVDQKQFKSLCWWLLALPPKAIMAAIVVTLILNHVAWKKEPYEISSLEERAKSATPAQSAAGKVFLKTSQAADPEAFFTELEPLLVEKDWVFPLDDPTEYQIDGVAGLPGSEEPKWKYGIALGKTKQNVDALIEQANDDVFHDNDAEAARKIAVTLGVGNRIAEQPQFIAGQIGAHILKKSTAFLQKHPQLASNPKIQVELLRAENIDQVLRNSLSEECAGVNRCMAEVVRDEDSLTVVSFAFPPQPMTQTFNDWTERETQSPADGSKFVRMAQIKLITQFQPLQAMIIAVALPYTTDTIKDGERLATVARNLQNSL